MELAFSIHLCVAFFLGLNLRSPGLHGKSRYPQSHLAKTFFFAFLREEEKGREDRSKLAWATEWVLVCSGPLGKICLKKRVERTVHCESMCQHT